MSELQIMFKQSTGNDNKKKGYTSLRTQVRPYVCLMNNDYYAYSVKKKTTSK